MLPRKAFELLTASIFLCFTSLVWANPSFKGVEFGKHSTRCDSSNAAVTTSPQGSAISILFSHLEVEAGTENHNHDSMRCDLALKFTAPLEVSTKIQLDVRGTAYIVGKGSVSSSISIRGRRQVLRFNAKADGFQRFVVKLPKGANKLDVSLTATAKGKFQNSSALVAIDSIDATTDKGNIISQGHN